jgi:DNA-binding CsgD family transcriptional regulator
LISSRGIPADAARDQLRPDGMLAVLEGQAAMRPKPDPILSGVRLTTREQEVLLHVNEGLSDKQIAFALQVSRSTVKTHARSLFEKLVAHPRTDALRVAREHGLISSAVGRQPRARARVVLAHLGVERHFRDVLLVGLTVDRGVRVFLLAELRRARHALARGVLGVLDQVFLRLLEALGLAASGLADRALGGIHLVVARTAADRSRLCGGRGLLLAYEVVVVVALGHEPCPTPVPAG